MAEIEFATDNGPVCARCKGTIWTYTFNELGIATCVGCRMVEGPLRRIALGVILPRPTTAVEARIMHEKFRAREG